MRKRSFVAVAFAALLAVGLFGLAGCTGSGTYQPELKSAEVAPPVIGKEGTLRVGVNTENPPLAGMGSGKIIGIDVDIAAALADELGLKLSVVDVGSDPAGALANGTVDVVLGIDDSSSDGDFWRSASYLPTGIALFALTPDAGIPTQDSGATFAAQVSSKSAWAVSNGFGESSLTPTDSLKEAFEALAWRPEACSTWPPTPSSACTRPMARAGCVHCRHARVADRLLHGASPARTSTLCRFRPRATCSARLVSVTAPSTSSSASGFGTAVAWAISPSSAI